MDGKISLFDPRILTGVITKRPIEYDFFTSLFSHKAPSPSNTFDLHVRSHETTMIPAISDVAPGSMRQQPGFEAFTLKAPRFRLKRAFMADQQFALLPGQTPYDPLGNTVDHAIAEMMDLFNEEFRYALEVMCCQATVDGKITLYNSVDGQVVPQFKVDFLRPSKHNVVLTDDAKWSNPKANIRRQLNEWNLWIQEETGFGAMDLILGVDAWEAFWANDDVQKGLDNRRIDLGSLSPRVAARYQGTWFGVNVYVYPGTYKDLDGTVKPYLPANKAVLIAKDAPAVIEYGKPVDVDCPGPAQKFVKSYKQDDPSGLFMVAESRPLPWPIWPGWVVVAQVIDPATHA